MPHEMFSFRVKISGLKSAQDIYVLAYEYNSLSLTLYHNNMIKKKNS